MWWIATTRGGGGLRGVVGVTCGRKRLKHRYSYRYRYRYGYSNSKNKRKKEDTIRDRTITNHDISKHLYYNLLHMYLDILYVYSM